VVNRIAALFVGFFIWTCAAWAADDTPAWLKDLTSITLPQYGPKVSTVVLLNEEQNSIAESGRVTTVTRTVIKILSRSGADVSFLEQYDTGGDKVRDFRAWMIAPSGKVKKYGKDEIIDLACAENDVYNECRRRLVSGKRDAEPGAVFGYESTVERQLFSNQLRFHFQDSSPVKMARFSVTSPAGWEVKSSSFNGAPAGAAASAGTYTWQMENLAPIEREPGSPSFLSIVPWVGVNLLGGAGKRPILTWPQAAKVLSELNDGQSEPNDAMVAKAKSLTEGAKTEIEKIRALGRFVQQVNYVSVQVNVSKGGGYKPHAASQVYQKLYGDCKDKANLMRALVKAAGLTAYPVAIYSGDRTHVTADWPSLSAFNHAISAIRVSSDTKAPGILEHPKLGRLLFFDPTDPFVPVGYLPDHEQSSMALVGERDNGDLVRVPAAAPAAAERIRQVDAVLKADGAIEGSFVETRTGEALATAVAHYRGNAKADFTKSIEHWIGQSVHGATASGIETQDNDAAFVLKGKFASASYAQHPQPRMLIFRAALLEHNELRLTEKTRKYPIVIDADELEETVRIELPADFKIDEIPPPVHLASQFGKYDASWTAKDGSVIFKRTLEIPAQTVPATQYGELKKFIDTIGGSAELPVVMLR
jgi:hypothetical protein